MTGARRLVQHATRRARLNRTRIFLVQGYKHNPAAPRLLPLYPPVKQTLIAVPSTVSALAQRHHTRFISTLSLLPRAVSTDPRLVVRLQHFSARVPLLRPTR